MNRICATIDQQEKFWLHNTYFHTLRREPFQELEAWLHSFRRLWEERFDRLDDYLLEMQATEQHTSNRIEDNNV